MATIVTLQPKTLVYEIKAFEHLAHATYKIPQRASLSAANLERGDSFPEDSNYKIIRSAILPEKSGMARLVKVTAYKRELVT